MPFDNIAQQIADAIEDENDPSVEVTVEGDTIKIKKTPKVIATVSAEDAGKYRISNVKQPGKVGSIESLNKDVARAGKVKVTGQNQIKASSKSYGSPEGWISSMKAKVSDIAKEVVRAELVKMIRGNK